MTPSLRNRWASFVGTGYFPEELPRCFTTEDLKVIVSNPAFNIERFKIKNDDGAVPASSKILPFSIPHIRGYRRQLGLPGPFHFIQLCHALVQHHAAIHTIISASSFSVFKDHAASDEYRYISKPDFKSFIEQKIIRSTGYRYLLNVDITRFYASIYTHSLPWAVHGKAFAKGNSGMSHYGNMLDTYARNCQDKQTMGIPIGPDSSRILSEILLATVDKQLKAALTDFNAIRNVDDYFLYFKTYADAEKGKTILQGFLREYELELNPSKERIVELPEIIESEWKTAIRSFRFRTDKTLQRADLITFFDLSFTYARKYPDDVVLAYAVAKLRGLFAKLHRSNWEIFQSLLLNAIVLEPKVVNQVVHTLLYITETRHFLASSSKVNQAFDSFITFHAGHDHHYEIIWALWYYLISGTSLPEGLSLTLSRSENDLIILLLLELDKQDLIEEDLDKEIFEALLSEDSLFEEHWLLAYEGVAGGYLATDDSRIRENKFFTHLLDNDIRFFKPEEEDEDDGAVDVPKSSLAREMEAERADGDDDND